MGNLFCCVGIYKSPFIVRGQFGKFNGAQKPPLPGCQFLPPFLGEQLNGYLPFGLQQLDIACETRTKDNLSVNVVSSVYYCPVSENTSCAFTGPGNIRNQIQALVFDVIRATVLKHNLDDAYEQSNEIAKAVGDELDEQMSKYGYEIVWILITDIEPDEHVKRAVNELNTVTRLRVGVSEIAEAKYLSGLGTPRQRQAITDGLRDRMPSFSVDVPCTTTTGVVNMVLVTQYFEAMKDTGAGFKP